MSEQSPKYGQTNMRGCQDLVASGAMERVWAIAARGQAQCKRQVGWPDVDGRLNRKVVSLLPIAEVLSQPIGRSASHEHARGSLNTSSGK